jgi:hypothetical protein
MSQRNQRKISQWLIQQAARRAPDCLSARLEEEWLADMDSRSTALSKLRLAFGCCCATVVIRTEYRRHPVAAVSTVAANGVIALADRNFAYFSLRSGTLFLILGHAALFCGLITTFSQPHGLARQPDVPVEALSSSPVEVSLLSGR